MCMSLCCSSHLLWRYIILRDHSHLYPITGTSKWLERLAFLVLIWVDKESSSRQTDLTCMNKAPHEHYSTAAATVPTQEYMYLLSATWLAMPISKDVTCVPNGSVWYAEIWNTKISNIYYRSRRKFSDSGYTIWLHHEFGLGSTVFSHVASTLPLNFLNFMQ